MSSSIKVKERNEKQKRKAKLSNVLAGFGEGGQTVEVAIWSPHRRTGIEEVGGNETLAFLLL